MKNNFHGFSQIDSNSPTWHVPAIPKKFDTHKLISWQGFEKEDAMYYTSYTIVKTPMWVYGLLASLERFFGRLKRMTLEHWEADWKMKS